MSPRWRLLRHGAGRAAHNMAVDEALLAECGRVGPTLRLYRWSRPSISLGYRQSAPEWLGRARELGLDIVRRASGGGAVVHAGDLTYAVAAPANAPGIPPTAHASYAWIQSVLLEALAGLDLNATPSRAAAGADRLSVCFSGATASEIELDGRKLVGSAQRRTRHGFLQHGSIRLANDVDVYARVLGTDLAPPPGALAGVEPDRVADAVQASFAAALSALSSCARGEGSRPVPALDTRAGSLEPGSLTARERARVRQLEALRDNDDLARPPLGTKASSASSSPAPLRADSVF